MIDYNIENELKPILSNGEKLQWTGKPNTGIVFRGSDFFLIPFSLFWCGFVFFWESIAIHSHAPFFFILWGLPFIFIGLYLVVGRFFLDARKRANTIYGITESRIIIKSGIFNRSINSLNIKVLPEINISEKSDGSGTITLGSADFRYTMMQGMEWPGMKQPPRLEMIGEVQAVYNRIIELQRK